MEETMSKTILRLLVERHAENTGTNLTQVARDMAMSLSTLTRKLDGQRQITIDEFHDLSVMLGIPMEALYGLLP